ncbi:MAG: hypothetical protein ACM3WU_01430 [Bacillota bacterium]
MKPIDAITGLPRSADVARIISAQGRQVEVQNQSQVAAFAREMLDRQTTVNETPKAENAAFDSDGGSGEGGHYGSMPKDKNSHEGGKENPAGEHPAKGKILDIRGS